MAELGTQLIVGIDIANLKGTAMKDLDFKARFFVLPNQYKEFDKTELLRIRRKEGDLYFALLDTALLGCKGEIKCTMFIKDPEPMYTGGVRNIILTASTGIMIGSYACNHHGMANKCNCMDYDEGVKITFNHMYSIPKPNAALIFYGSIIDQINGFGEITESMLLSPDNNIVSVDASPMGKTSAGTLSAGNKVVVAIPVEYAYNAYKDNGFGGKVQFDETVMGTNGGYEITISGERYRLYGEMLLVNGEMNIYVN